MNEQRSTRGRRSAGVLAWIAVAVLAVAPLACSSESTAVTESTASAPRPEQTGQGTTADGEFCEAVAAFAASAPDATPEQLLEDLGELRAIAPDGVADDLQTIEDVVRTLTDLDESDPASFRTVLEALLDARVGAAIAAFGDYSLSQCGVRLDDGGLGGLGG